MYGLHRSGKKDELLVRLVEFSEGGMDLWKNKVLSFSVRAHNGPTDGPKKRKLNKREAWLNEAKVERASHDQHGARSKDKRTQVEKDNVKIAMREVMAIVRRERQENSPLRNSHLPSTAVERTGSQRTHMPTAGPSISPPFLPSPSDPIGCQLFVQSIASAHQFASTNIGPMLPVQPLVVALSPSAAVPLSVTTLAPGPLAPPNNEVSTPAPSLVPSEAKSASPLECDSMSTDMLAKISIQIDGKPFMFTKREISPPDPLRFSDTTRLLVSWDDDGWNPVYAPGSVYPIRIRGQPIPLVFLPLLYRNNLYLPKVWEKEKNKWTQYRDFVHEYRRLGEDDFWAVYSDTKGRMSFTALIKEMRTRRAVYNDRLVKQARDEYGSRFDVEFAYADGHGHKVVMTAAPKIARAYCKKMGLEYIGGSDDNE